MRTLRTSLALLAPLALLLSGCDNSSVRVLTVPVDEFGPRYAAIVCEDAAQCCGDDAGVPDAGALSVTDCESALQARIAQRFEEASSYDGEQARDCLQLRSAQTACGRFEASGVCDAVTGAPLLPDGVPDDLCAP